MSTLAPSTRELPGAYVAPGIPSTPAPGTRAVPSDPLACVRGLALALPLSLLLWAAILRAAWWLCRG